MSVLFYYFRGLASYKTSIKSYSSSYGRNKSDYSTICLDDLVEMDSSLGLGISS